MHTFANHAAGTSTQRADSSGGSRSRSGPPLPPPPQRSRDAMSNAARRIAVIEPDLRRAIDAELDAGERIVWLRQPVPWLLWRSSLVVLIFGVPWTGFAVFWTLGAAGLVG